MEEKYYSQSIIQGARNELYKFIQHESSLLYSINPKIAYDISQLDTLTISELVALADEMQDRYNAEVRK